MKFNFICIVIILSCTVSASGDLEIYPDLKIDLSAEEQRPRLDNTRDYYRKNYLGWPWQTSEIANWRNKVLEQDLELPEQIQKIEEYLEQSQKHIPNEDDPAFYPRPESFNNIYSGQLERNTVGYQGQKNNFFDPVKAYPHENDFTFSDSEDEDFVDKPIFQNVPRDTLHNLAQTHFAHKHNNPKTNNKVKINDNFFENVKIVDDTSQFAYLPSDLRFFENYGNYNGDRTTKGAGIERLTGNHIRITQRSDEGLRKQNIDPQTRSSFKTNDQVRVVAVGQQVTDNDSTRLYIIAVVAGVSAAATVGLIAVGIGWYNLQKHVKSASDVEYPAYGVTGPNKDTSPSGDRRLAQSAQMYHYQHQKQQIIAMESRAAGGDRHGSISEVESEEDNEEGDYTVYECPGLAPTGEMEVKNPLFQDDPTPAQTPPVKPNETEEKN